ncbi:MAG: hypothetical protein E7410_00905 [Ruminococcaceae bacterium]|nr:hypothetical protein [Oscillospiraceae bacterium]
MPNKKDEMVCEDAIRNVENVFALKGKEIVKNGMLLILDRLRFAKKYDKKIREAICAIDEDDELKSAQVKSLIETLKRESVMDTSEVLSLVTEIIKRLSCGGEKMGEGQNELLVTLDERVKQWAK